MHKPTIISSVLILSSLLFLGASCATGTRTEAGIHKSTDFGTTWQPSNSINPDLSQNLLTRASILDLQVDTEVTTRVYAATRSQGLFLSENKGDTWEPITTPGQIQAFSIAQDNTTLIAARSHQLYLSTDQGEIWQLVYTNPNQSLITDVIFDPLNENIIYASVVTGELLQTRDLGKSWASLHDFEETISEIELERNSRQRIYVVLPEEGVYRSTDGGNTWSELTDSIQRPIDQFTNPLIYRNLIIHPGNPDDLLIHTSQGLYASSNAQMAWRELQLLTDADKRQIRAIGWDPLNRERIYYSTPTVFYQSENFGRTWTTIPFSSAFPPSHIVPDRYSSGIIYLGTKQE